VAVADDRAEPCRFYVEQRPVVTLGGDDRQGCSRAIVKVTWSGWALFFEANYDPSGWPRGLSTACEAQGWAAILGDMRQSAGGWLASALGQGRVSIVALPQSSERKMPPTGAGELGVAGWLAGRLCLVNDQGFCLEVLGKPLTLRGVEREWKTPMNSTVAKPNQFTHPMTHRSLIMLFRRTFGVRWQGMSKWTAGHGPPQPVFPQCLYGRS